MVKGWLSWDRGPKTPLAQKMLAHLGNEFTKRLKACIANKGGWVEFEPRNTKTEDEEDSSFDEAGLSD